MNRSFVAAIVLIASLAGAGAAENLSPNGVRTLAPEGGIKPTATWALGTRAGDFVYVAGMRGIDAATDTLVTDDEARVRKAFENRR